MFNQGKTKGYPSRRLTSPTAPLGFATLALLLNACVTPDAPRPLNLADNFGNAVRHNIAAQVINPDAAGPDESDRIDGQSAERALESHRTRSIESEPGSLIIGAGGGN